MEDPGFWEWVKTPRSQGGGGLKSGDPIATQTAYNELMRQYVRSSGENFQPSAMAVTNPVNTNQVIPVLMTSPSSAMPFPQPSYKEGRVNDQGNAMVFDAATGTYFPATNTATGATVQPTDKSGPDMGVMMFMSPPERALYLQQFLQPPGTPTDDMTNSMAFQNVQPTGAPAPAAGGYETNMPVPTNVAAPAGSAAMGVPAPAPAAVDPAAAAPASQMTAEQIRAAYQAGQLTKEQARQMLMGVR
jgi:hypothetical protein